jgi:hypothetical protein
MLLQWIRKMLFSYASFVFFAVLQNVALSIQLAIEIEVNKLPLLEVCVVRTGIPLAAQLKKKKADTCDGTSI